ncbi:hypothetical protein Tco_0875865 [Tanacetum coccineum]|uniref:Uncharacterized protein n=1 Tax=Tanacetum coccineum TaxID=301880 RepID=A0ABQ5BVN9_9ASTR
MSSECDNITLSIRNAKSEIVCVMCKQCLVTANHDVCMLNYVNDVNSRADNQSVNVSIRENQKKHKANAKKSKELGSKRSFASSKPSKPRTCLRWIPTGRIFAMCRKFTASSNTENKFEKSVCDNASTSNPSEPSSKGFSNSASLLGSKSNALSKHFTSNLAPSSHESSVVNNERVIAPGIFRINPFKASKVDIFVPNKHVKASVRTKPITVSQPHVVTKEDVNSAKFRQKWKPKKVGSKERLALPKPSTPSSCLRWSPTGRMFDLKGKIIATSESVCQSDCSKGDNACTSNPQEPICKRFPNSTFSMTGCQNWFDTLLIPLLSEYKSKDKETHGDNECDN